MSTSMRLSRRPAGAASASLLFLCVMLLTAPSNLWVSSFQPARTTTPTFPLSPTTTGRSRSTYHHPYTSNNHNRWERAEGSSTSLNSFLGADGGLFGVGTPELATILLVGYFVLGPSDLYKLVKEVGKFIQNIRTLGTEATKNFEDTMESQLDLQEIRKAQAELNDAFAFRRSINVDDQGGAFSTTPNTYEPETGPQEPPVTAAAAAATAGAAAAEGETAPPKRKKKKRRRVKKKQPAPEPTVSMDSSATSGSIPDLDMSDAFPDLPKEAKDEEKDEWFKDGMPSASDMAKEDLAWLENADSDDSTTTTTTPSLAENDPAMSAQEQNRFQQQLNAGWNQKVMDNEDELAPLAMVMERLAILEEEKAAADKRLEDEFRERFQLEEDFYQQKRDVLEESAAKVQEEAYVTMEGGSSKSKK